MFFILSKTLSFLVMPFILVCLCFLVSVLIRNPKLKKRFFWSGFIMLFFFSNDFIANEVMLAWEIKTKAYADMKPHAVGIVLTGATIPLLKPKDRVYFSHGADRVIHAVQLYKLGLIKKVLISGGNGRLTDIEEREAIEFKNAMLVMGVPEQDIITESETRNTYESAVEVSKILKGLGYKDTDCLLITSAFHMRRSLACYRKAGLDVESFSTDFYAHPRNFYLTTLVIPNLDAISLWQKVIREWVGFAAYKVAGYI